MNQQLLFSTLYFLQPTKYSTAASVSVDQLTTGISTFLCGMSPWSHLPMQRSTIPRLKTTEHSKSRKGILLRRWSHKSSDSPYWYVAGFWKDFISHLHQTRERCSDTLGQCPVAALSPQHTAPGTGSLLKEISRSKMPHCSDCLAFHKM